MAQLGSQKLYKDVKIFSFNKFSIVKFWLNCLVDDCHLDYIIKLENKTLMHTTMKNYNDINTYANVLIF
jgi:hypothetical protein